MTKALPFAALLLALAGCQGAKPAKKDGPAVEMKPPVAELEIKDTAPGTGEPAENGDLVWVRYTGKLRDGTVFDTNIKEGGQLFKVPIGAGQVIKGWDMALVGVKTGMKRTVGIPWTLAYGSEGSPPKIPPKSDLWFDIEVVDMVRRKEDDVIERETLKEGTGRAAKAGDTVEVDYVGTLVDGTQWDDRKDYSFKIGGGTVYEFFDHAVEGMKVGGRRKVRIPPKVGFGPGGGGMVGANELIYLDVTLKKIK